MKSRWSIPALGAFFVALALAVAGCGSSGGVPSGAAASVGGNPISQRALYHWMYIDEKSQSAQSPNTPIIVPTDPPQFSSCVTQAKAEVAALKSTPVAKVRSECSALFTSLNTQVLDFLIKGYWYQALAAKQGTPVTDAQVSAALAKERKAEFKTTAAYQSFLTEYGYTANDLLWRTRYTTVLNKLTAKHSTKVTPAAIAAYYKQHASSFGTPQRRNLRIVLTKTAAQAKKAQSALKGGQSFAAVAKKYSVDTTTNKTGGLVTGVTKGEEEAQLSTAAFAAPVNKLEGPIKTDFGYYVFEVVKITPATQEPLKTVSPQIRETLSSANSTAATNAVNAAAKKAFGSRTTCAKYFAIADCKGYKAPATSSTAASGGTGAASGASGATGAATATTPATSTAASSSATTTTSSSSQ